MEFDTPSPVERRRASPLLRLLVLALLIVAAGILAWRTSRLEAVNEALEVRPPTRFAKSLVVGLRPPAGRFDLQTADVPLLSSFAPGDTLSRVLEGLGLEGAEARELTAELGAHVDPRTLRAGDPYAVYFDESGGLSGFQLTVLGKGRVRARRADTRWQASWHAFERRLEMRHASGVLEGSLIGSLERAGARSKLAFLMAEALQWDLDFNRDLRLGDTFQVLYERLYLDGRNEGPASLVAVSYVNQGRSIEAFRFGEDDSFYDSEGRPLRKMFLRSPLRFSRITSRFSHRRLHPVLKVHRPHYGVDYGAPTGTPVRVTASGSVSFAGWNKGGGRTVKVRHPNDFETAYLHLSRFASGIRAGRRVQQGDVIGYVGSTGLSTGPHLDYRVRHRGRWIDPLSIKRVPADPIPQKEMARFAVWRDQLRVALAKGEVPVQSVPRQEQVTVAETAPTAAAPRDTEAR